MQYLLPNNIQNCETNEEILPIFKQDRNNLEQHLINLGKQCPLNSFPIHQFNPYPFQISQNFTNYLEILSKLVYKSINIVFQNYFQDQDLQNYLPLAPKIYNLLKKGHLSGKKIKIGSWRPDFILTNNKLPKTFRGQPINQNSQYQAQLCEINARYPINGYFCSSASNKALSKINYLDKTQIQYFNQLENINNEILKQFDLNSPLYVFKMSEGGWDIHILSEIIGLENVVFLKDCSILENRNGELFDKQNNRKIVNLYMELQQCEIEQLDEQILEGVFGVENCFNNLHTIYLVHDKKLLSIFCNENIMSKYLNEEEALFLKQNIIPTYNINYCDKQIIQQAQYQRHKYILKPNLFGKGRGFLIGKQSIAKQWNKALLENGNNYILQNFITQDQFPIIKMNKEEQKVQIIPMYIIGILHIIGDTYYGPGIFRANGSTIVNVSDGGQILIPCTEKTGAEKPPSLEIQCQDLSTTNSSDLYKIDECKLYTKQQIFNKALEKNFYIENKQSIQKFEDFPITTKTELHKAILDSEETPNHWNNLYISPSGGTSGKSLYVTTDIRENKFQRQCLGNLMKQVGMFHKNDRHINLFSGTHIYRSLEIMNDFCEINNATTLPMSLQASDQDIVAAQQHFKANALMGSPTRILQLAKYIQQNNIRIQGWKKLYYGCEPLTQQKQDFIKENLKIDEFNAIYGSAEVGIIAYQPNFVFQQDSRVYLFDKNMIHIEIIDDDSQPTEGIGKIVITNLLRYKKVPLIRFDMGDMGKLIKFKHKEYDYDAIYLAGRNQKSFLVGRGFYYTDSIDKTFEKDLLEYQIVLDYNAQVQKDELILMIVKRPEATEDISYYQTMLENCLMQQDSISDFLISVKMVQVEDFIRSKVSNKFIKIVDKRQ